MQGFKIIGRIILLGAVSLLLSISSAQAALVVDTGAGSSTSGGTSLVSSQWLAGQFTLSESYTINSVEGWFGKGAQGTVTSAIYNDAGSGIPDGGALFAQQFILDTPDNIGTFGNAWDGAYGLNWMITAGTYWLAFEVRTGDTGNGWMPSEGSGALSPLANYALGSATTWLGQPSTIAWGMRIDATEGITPSAAPVPAAVWLFGTALIGMFGFNKRRKVA